jgi:hypothetical protein
MNARSEAGRACPLCPCDQTLANRSRAANGDASVRTSAGAQEPGGWYCPLAALAFLIAVMASSMDISTVVFDAAAVPAPTAVNNGAAALALSGASYNKTTSYSPKAKK